MEQLTRDRLRTMTPEQIQEARLQGALDQMLTGKPPNPRLAADDQLTREDLADLTHEQIVQAHNKGQLSDLLRGAHASPDEGMWRNGARPR